ncbi:hypothetical protein JCM10450v2_002634 [Rhodotorula kratochvilovae]
MSSRDRIKPSQAPTGEAALYKRAGGRAAFMTAEDGGAQSAPGVGTGWGGGIMLKQGNDPPPPVVCDQDDDGSGVAKQTLDPRRALDALQRQAAVKAKRTAAGGSDARGWSAPVPAAALAPRLAPNGTTAAPPAVNGAALPSFADHVRLNAAEVSHHAPPHAHVASTSSAHAPPAAPALRADLSREIRPDGVSRRDAAPAESPWSIYEPAMPSHTVEPVKSWATGRSEFCAAQKFAPPDFHPRGYNDSPAPPPAQPVAARSWAEQGAAKRAAAKAAKAGSAGGSSASGVPTRPVANTTHTSKWATAAPAPAPPAALASLPPGVQAAVASHTHAHAQGGSPPALNGAAPAPRTPAASTSASRYTNVSPVAPTPVRPPAVPPVPATATAKSSTAARPAAAPSASKYATSSSAPAASGSTPANVNAAPSGASKPAPPPPPPAREAATATQEDKARAAPSAAGGTVRPKAADDRTVGELEQRLIDLSRRKATAAAQRAEKKTPEELDALMEKMRVMNLDVRNKMEAAEQDRVAFEAEASARRTAEIDALVKAERERTAALDEMQREERAKKARTAEIQRQIDEERARSAARKLAHASGRAWDAGKLSSPSRGGSPPPAPAPAAYPSVEAAARDEARARAEREREPERALAEEEAERIRRRDGVRAEEGGWETVVHQEEAGRAQLVVHE